jgi:serine/threonine protein kinase/HAMP domain-containing protein
MNNKIGENNNDQSADKTQFDPASLAHRKTTEDDPDRTVIDKNSPLHKGRLLAEAAVTPTAAHPLPVTEERDPRDKTVTIVTKAAPQNDGPTDKTVTNFATQRLPSRGATTTNDHTALLNELSPDPTKPESAYTPAYQPAETLALPSGFRLMEYRIDAVLGQGGFGITYLATDVNLNSKFAIKEYLPEDFAKRSTDRTVSAKTLDDTEMYTAGLENFLIEARTLATFKHPNIVRVARFFEQHNTAYMVLEYERGQSLKVWRKNHPDTPEADLLNLLFPLLDGLSVMHENGFLHRDIKPDNIYVRDEDGSLVLLDFGAASQTALGSAAAVGVFTPGYGPIEQCQGTDNQGPWTDIYAMGATLFWFITGKKPVDSLQRAGRVDPLPLAEETCLGRYSPEFLKAIDWSLRVDPTQRPQSVAEFRTALFAAHASSLQLAEALRAGEDFDSTGNFTAAELMRRPAVLKTKILKGLRAIFNPASWPIAVKMTLAMMFTALLPMIITAFYNSQNTISIVSKAELKNLEQLAHSTAGRISQLLGDSKSLANYLGSDDDFVAFLSAPTEKGKADIKSKLEGLVKANTDVQLVLVMDTEGVALSSNDPAVIGRNFKFREYFKAAMEGKQFTSGISVGAVAGQAGIFYSNPVYNAEKKIIGAVVLRILGSSVSKILAETQGADARTPILIDADGVVIHHPNKDLLYSSLVVLSEQKVKEILADQRFRRPNITPLYLTDLAKAMIGAKDRGNVAYFSPVSKSDEIAGYAPVPGHNWVVGMTETRETFEAPLKRLFENVLYSVLLVGLIFLVLALIFARTIVKPIQELTAAADSLKNGDYEKAHVTVRNQDEVGQLARTFNVLIDVLRQREREREGKGRKAR